MNKSFFDETDLYLLDNWSQVRLLEISVEAVRGKYDETFQRILDAVQEKHQDLDRRSVRVGNGGRAGIARSRWPLPYGPSWPPGLWLEDIGLENLISEEEKAPCAVVWVKPPERMGLDQAKDRLYKAARQVLTKSELKQVNVETARACSSVWYYLAEDRADLLQMLRADRARKFIDCMVAHYERLTRFKAAVDQIYSGRNG